MNLIFVGTVGTIAPIASPPNKPLPSSKNLTATGPLIGRRPLGITILTRDYRPPEWGGGRRNVGPEFRSFDWFARFLCFRLLKFYFLCNFSFLFLFGHSPITDCFGRPCGRLQRSERNYHYELWIKNQRFSVHNGVKKYDVPLNVREDVLKACENNDRP